MSSFELLACALLILISAALASSEVALFSLSRFQLRLLRDRFKPAYRRIKRLLGDPGGLLISILVANEIVNISISSLITSAVFRGWNPDDPGILHSFHLRYFPYFPHWAMQTAADILITAPILLILCEVTPKAVGVRVNQMVAPLASRPLLMIYIGLKPLRIFLKAFIELVTKLIGKYTPSPHRSDNEPLLKEEEFLFMVEEGHKEGTIQENELELIRNVFELDDKTVAQVYTPLSQVFSLPASTSVKAAVAAMKAQRYSRVPVTGLHKKQLVGVLYAKDLLLAKLGPHSDHATIASLMRKPYTVSPGVRLNGLFRRMKQHRTHLAVVENSAGEAVGVVTMGDVLDELLDDVLPDADDLGPAPGMAKK